MSFPDSLTHSQLSGWWHSNESDKNQINRRIEFQFALRETCLTVSWILRNSLPTAIPLPFSSGATVKYQLAERKSAKNRLGQCHHRHGEASGVAILSVCYIYLYQLDLVDLLHPDTEW